MQREVIACLAGCCGSIFYEDQDDCSIQVTKGLSFLHPSEEALLKRIAILGTQYKKLRDFEDQYSQVEEDIAPLHGAYASAFVNGVSEVLKPYKVDLWQLELEVIQDPCISLTRFLQLERYSSLFIHLWYTIDNLVKNEIRGCQILEILYQATNTGIPMVEIAMQRILKGCNVVLLSQLRYWMVDGRIYDPEDEFFIGVNEKISESVHKIINEFLENSEVQPMKYYRLKEEHIPSYIPIAVAEKILFVGQTIEILGPRNSKNIRESCEELKEREKYVPRLLELGKSEQFSLLQFMTLIEEIRLAAAEQVWKVIVQDADLISHLHLAKDFYLLGKGDLYYRFIESVNKSLKKPLNSMTLRETRITFEAVVSDTCMEDTFVHNFHLLFLDDVQEVDKPNEVNAPQETGWSSLGLIYETPAPLNAVFTDRVLDKYLALFRFLISVRRVQIELQQCFFSQLVPKRIQRHTPVAFFCQLWSHMSFLVNNLQFYLQVDVVESQFAIFLHSIETEKDFGKIQDAHTEYLSALTIQCFLQLKPVYNCILEILDLCASFCGLFTKVQDQIGATEMLHFENIRLNFQRQTSLLIRLLGSIRSHQASPLLSLLLMQLDYNRYITLSGGHLGGTLVENK